MKEIFVDLTRCQGCKSCVLACAVEHSASKSLFSALRETSLPRPRIFVEYSNGKKFPLQCRHCEEAPCVMACISGAMRWDEDSHLVTHRKEKCVGCWMCVMVCPLGVITREVEEKRALKCDGCPERDIPACVEACPVKALLFLELEEVEKMKRRVVLDKILV